MDDTLLVYNLCALTALTPFESEFFDFVEDSIPTCDISEVLYYFKYDMVEVDQKVISKGTIKQK